MPGNVIVNQPGIIQVDSTGQLVNEGLTTVEFVNVSTTEGPNYFLWIDLDNAGGTGPYKHTETGAIQIAATFTRLTKDKAQAAHFTGAAVILEIDGTSAQLGFLGETELFNDNSTLLTIQKTIVYFPLVLELRPDGLGGIDNIVSNNIVTDTNINTGVTIPDIGGNLRTPAVGDLILKEQRIEGTGSASWDYAAIYRTVV